MGNSEIDAFIVSDACFAKCQITAVFIDENIRIPIDTASVKQPGGTSFQGMLFRVIGWLRSLGKLNHPGDFQAVVSGTRALLEIAVDVTLLQGDPVTYPIAKLQAWESSAKLKQAAALKEHLELRGLTPKREQLPTLSFLAREESRILALRSQYWTNRNGNPTHPMRWTKESLAKDAEAADTLDDLGFLDFYRNRYSQLCWNVHGSGLAGVSNISADLIPFLSGQAFNECSWFSLIAVEKIARHLQTWTPEMKDAFDNVRQQLVFTAHEIMTQGSSRTR